MGKHQKRLLLSRGGLSILSSNNIMRVLRPFCFACAALIIASCGFRPVYDSGYKTQAPDILAAITITGDKETAIALRQALKGHITTTNTGQYNVMITLSTDIRDDIVERSAQASRKRLFIKKVIVARHTRPPHIEKTRTRIYDTAYSDRRDELANMNQRNTLRDNLIEQMREDIMRYLIYLSEKEAAHGTQESP